MEAKGMSKQTREDILNLYRRDVALLHQLETARIIAANPQLKENMTLLSTIYQQRVAAMEQILIPLGLTEEVAKIQVEERLSDYEGGH